MLNKRKWRIIAIPIVLVMIFALSYLPHNPLDIKSSTVSKIHDLNGNTGYEVEITNESDKKYIIKSLNGTYQKGKFAFGYMGYGYRVKIFNQKGTKIKDFYINSDNTIRLNGFFFKTKDHFIDYYFLEELLEKMRLSGQE